MKTWCETCEGGQLDTSAWKCAECDGKGYTNPPQQILDDLECAEIERGLVKSNVNIQYRKSKIDRKWRCELYSYDKWEGVVHQGETKLEALRKAKEWIEGRG